VCCVVIDLFALGFAGFALDRNPRVPCLTTGNNKSRARIPRIFPTPLRCRGFKGAARAAFEDAPVKIWLFVVSASPVLSLKVKLCQVLTSRPIVLRAAFGQNILGGKLKTAS